MFLFILSCAGGYFRLRITIIQKVCQTCKNISSIQTFFDFFCRFWFWRIFIYVRRRNSLYKPCFVANISVYYI